MSMTMSLSLFVYKKHCTCSHKYGCFEWLLRVGGRTLAYWLVAKGAF